MSKLIWLVNDLIKKLCHKTFDFEIDKVFKEIDNDDLNKIFLCVFPSIK